MKRKAAAAAPAEATDEWWKGYASGAKDGAAAAQKKHMSSTGCTDGRAAGWEAGFLAGHRSGFDKGVKEGIEVGAVQALGLLLHYIIIHADSRLRYPC